MRGRHSCITSDTHHTHSHFHWVEYLAETPTLSDSDFLSSRCLSVQRFRLKGGLFVGSQTQECLWIAWRLPQDIYQLNTVRPRLWQLIPTPQNIRITSRESVAIVWTHNIGFNIIIKTFIANHNSNPDLCAKQKQPIVSQKAFLSFLSLITKTNNYFPLKTILRRHDWRHDWRHY